MIHWKWTQGEPYERSRRSRIIRENMEESSLDQTLFYDNKVLNDKQLEKHANNAFNIALNHDENTWDMLNPSQNETPMNIQPLDFKQVNKREDTDKKLAERQMFANVSMNPFLTNNDYVNDITVQNDFLKPQTNNSSYP